MIRLILNGKKDMASWGRGFMLIRVSMVFLGRKRSTHEA